MSYFPCFAFEGFDIYMSLCFGFVFIKKIVYIRESYEAMNLFSYLFTS